MADIDSSQKNTVENSAKNGSADSARTRGLKPYQPGKSGNPKGRPKGSPNKHSLKRRLRKVDIAEQMYDAAIKYLGLSIGQLDRILKNPVRLNKLSAVETEALVLVRKSVEGDAHSKRWLHNNVLGTRPTQVTSHSVKADLVPEIQKRMRMGEAPDVVYGWLQETATDLRLEAGDFAEVIKWGRALIWDQMDMQTERLKQQAVFSQEQLARIIGIIKNTIVPFFADRPEDLGRFGQTLRQNLEAELNMKVVESPQQITRG